MGGRTTCFYDFGPFRVDPAERLLLFNGDPVRLAPKAFDVLLLLVQNSGHLVDKEHLINKVWPDTFVEEGNLKVTVFALRKALEDAGGHGYIETVPKRGYRFTASVRESWNEHVTPTAGERDREDTGGRSVAILPFRILGAGDTDDYLGVGLADTLITRLGNLKQIVVRPTSAVLKYAGAEQNPVAIGREVKVDSVLEGSVRRSGQRVRVTVQLVKAQDGTPLWADKFDETFTDIFAVEDSISAKVAEALVSELTGEHRKLLTKRYTENTEAYHLYLKGRYYWAKRTSDGFKRAIEYFQQAIDIDPLYALAYSGLADCYAQLSWGRISAPGEVFPRAKAAAAKALEIDDQLAEAHTSMAWIKLLYDWEWAGARKEFERAIELNPNYAIARLWYTVYFIATGKFDEALLEIKRAQEIDPLSPLINTIAGWPFYFARQYDRAVAAYLQALELDPNCFAAHVLLGYAYEQQGARSEAMGQFQKVRLLDNTTWTLAELGHAYAMSGMNDRARDIINELRELSGSRYVSPYDVAQIYACLGEKDQALEWLQKSLEDRPSWLIFLGVEPRLDGLRADARFIDLLRRVLPQNAQP